MTVASANPPRRGAPRSLTAAACVFAAVAAANSALFVLRHPLRWQQPETLRLHYYALQDGIREGPLTAALTRTDLLKPFVWRSHGGMYDARQPSMLLDALVAKLDQALYRIRGPFLDEPFFMLIGLLTAVALAWIGRRWFASWAPGLVAGGMWLMTTEALLGLRYNCRSNMPLVALLTVVSFCLLAALRERPRGRARGPALLLLLILIAQCHTHEVSLCLLPALALWVGLQWRSFRPHAGLVGLVLALPGLVYAAVLLGISRWAVWKVTGESPPLGYVGGALAPFAGSPAVLLARTRDFFLNGLRWFWAYNLGGSPYGPPLLDWSARSLSLLLFLGAGLLAWRRVWRFLAAWLLYVWLITVFIFPREPTSVQAETYYYASIAASAMIMVAALGADIFSRRRPALWYIMLGGLLLIGALNTRTAGIAARRYPSWFGYGDQAQCYVQRMLRLSRAVRGRSLPIPAYAAYPRPRRMGISERWDLMLRVWNNDPFSVFAMMMPVLNLRHFEERTLLGNPDEFRALVAVEEGGYLAAANAYLDLPAGTVYDLASWRKAIVAGAVSPGDWRACPPSGRAPVAPEARLSLLGLQVAARLPPGCWRLRANIPAGGPERSLLFLLRADLTPDGGDDVLPRTVPTTGRRCLLVARRLDTGEELMRREQTYDWAFQIFAVPLPAAAGEVEIEVAGDAEVEVIGPALLPAALSPRPLFPPGGRAS